MLYKHFTVRMYYRDVRKVTLDHDFFLINDFMNKFGGAESFHIDHIMIGDKFIYCIRDRYYPGVIEAKEDDPKWLYYCGKKKTAINNPLLLNKLRVERLSLITAIDSKELISIVLVNNDCMMTPLSLTKSDSFLVSLKKFPKLIELLESQDVPPLDPNSAALLARDFSELNLNGKK